ncbi:DUF4365 domain-containing protein [Pseudomonas sp. SDT291_1_S447]
MSKRAISQKIGARGHKWLYSHIEENPHWLSRDLGEDYGIDMEFELHENYVEGEILKVQVKSVEKHTQKEGLVKLTISRKYLRYADACRYPVILVLVCLETKQAWYIWLQEWLLEQRTKLDPMAENRRSWTAWVPVGQTIQAGLCAELKSIARWEGQTQLTLTLYDAIRCAKAANKPTIAEAVQPLVNISSSYAGTTGLNTLIEEAIKLGDTLRGTHEGELVTQQIYEIIRHAGEVVTKETAIKLVARGTSYSRAGINALCILYDEHRPHALSLDLSTAFEKLIPDVSFYCAFREKYQDNHISPPKDFRHAGLKYVEPDDAMSKYINRGASAILDYLVLDNLTTIE